MKFIRKYKLSLYLALAALIATILALAIYNSLVFMYGVALEAIFVIALIAGIVTFCISAFGIKLFKTNHYKPMKAAYIGGVLGFVAYGLVALLSLFLMVSPDYYDRAANMVIIGAFMFGGFLGPIVGAITGYKLARARCAKSH